MKYINQCDASVDVYPHQLHTFRPSQEIALPRILQLGWASVLGHIVQEARIFSDVRFAMTNEILHFHLQLFSVKSND